MRAFLRWTWHALLLALIALVAVQFWFLAHIWYWADHNPESTAFMRARLVIIREDAPNARLAHRWVPYHLISTHLKRAVVAAEDDKFTGHSGFDWEAMRKAHEKNVREGEIVSGASTISQQLAKNLFLPGCMARRPPRATTSACRRRRCRRPRPRGSPPCCRARAAIRPASTPSISSSERQRSSRA
jgi:membrane peptidoglycan carboxypeptidase